MLKNYFKISLIIFFTVNFNIDCQSIENKIVYKVDNEIITSIDIKIELKYLSALNPKILNLDKNRIFEIAKNSIIREKIKKIELNKNNAIFDIDQDFLDRLIKNRYLKIGIKSEKEFINYLIQFDLKIEDIKEKLTVESLWNELIYIKYRSSLKIDKNKIKENIKNNKQDMIRSFNLSEIVFNIENNEEIDTKYKIIKKTISEKGFENAALIYSISGTSNIGGKLGWVKEGSLNKKLMKQIQNLNKGDSTQPTIIPGGFLIIKLNEVKETKKEIDINKEVEKVVISKTNEQLSQFSNIYFNKIKRNIKIEKI